MKFYIIALIGILFGQQVYGRDCDSLDKLTKDEDFNECVLSGAWTKPLLYGEKYDVDTNDDCGWVVEVLPKVKQLIESGSDADVIRDQFKLEMCGTLNNPENKQKCEDLTDTMYKRVIVLLFLGVPNERIAGLMGVCNKIGAKCDNAYSVCGSIKTAKSCGRSTQCTKFMWTTPEFAKSVAEVNDDSFVCSQCKVYIGEIQQLLDNGSTRQEIIDDADNICERFFSADECEKYVGETIGEILMLLENDVTPDQLCSLLGLCKSSKTIEENIIPVAELVPALKDDSFVCSQCQVYIGEIQQLLEDGSTRQEVIDDADNICERFFSSEECETYVGESIGEILDLLENDVTAEEICALLGMCKSASIEKGVNSVAEVVNADSFVCSQCKVYVGEIQKLLDNGSTRQMIIDDADKICERFFSADECETYVGESIGEILDLLENDVTPEEVCNLLELCKSTPPNKQAIQSVSEDVICEGCEALFATIKEYLANDEVIQYVEQEADQLCQYCPEQQTCQTLINTYLPQVIAMLQNYLNPTGVCREMGMCGQDVTALTNYLLKPFDQQFVAAPVDMKLCPNGEDCNDGETCCPGKGKNAYGCCPMPDAVCCVDQVHCCPSGYTCGDSYCMKSDSNQYPGFDFAFPVEIRQEKTSSRPRRQAMSSMESQESMNQETQLQAGISKAQVLLSQGLSMLETQVSDGACTACNLVMKHRLYEVPLSQEEFATYVTELKETVCKEATEKGVECPTTEGVQEILEAAKQAPAGSECPLKSLCTGSPLQSFASIAQSLTESVDDVMCLAFEKLMSHLGDDQSWTDMEDKVQKMGENAPITKLMLVKAIEMSKQMYGNADAAFKVALIRQQAYNYIPDLKNCEKAD